MLCPKCGAKTAVKDSRRANSRNTIRRRRECSRCQYKFTTEELTCDGNIELEFKRFMHILQDRRT